MDSRAGQPTQMVADAVEETAAAAAKASERRRQALEPFASHFLAWADEIELADVPHFVEIEGWTLELGAWERSTLKAEGRGKRSWSNLAEGVAYQIGCLDLEETFERGPMPPPAELPAFLDGLVIMVAVGGALADELQWDMNTLIGKGRLGDAKSLSAFRSKVLHGLGQLQARVGHCELEQAEQRRCEFVSIELPEDEPPPPPKLKEEPRPAAPQWALHRDRRPDTELPPWLTEESGEPAADPVAAEQRRSRLKPLLMLLVVLLVAYSVVMLPRLNRPSGPPALHLEHFAHVELVRGIVAHPPSLYVIVDAEAWQEASAEERSGAMAEIGEVAGRNGYSGVHARTTAGTTVGEWLSKTGVRLTGAETGAS